VEVSLLWAARSGIERKTVVGVVEESVPALA
jgi:hypothetical protein